MKDYEEKVLNIMDSAKDNIRTQLDKAYKSGYEDAKSTLVQKAYKDGYADAKSELGQNAIDLAHAESDRAYQQGLEDAWEFIQKLLKDACDGGYTVSLLQNALGYCNISDIVRHYDISEAIAKINEYEEQQQKFAIGDEVYSDAFDDKGIITHITADKVSCVCIICNGSTMMKVGTNDLHKTGRHFPQIAEVLAEIRGEE